MDSSSSSPLRDSWLFGFAIRGYLDRVVRRGRMENDHILNWIVRIGLYDWSRLDRQGGGKQPPIQIRYAAVLGMQLWKRINVLSNQVSLLFISYDARLIANFVVQYRRSLASTVGATARIRVGSS